MNPATAEQIAARAAELVGGDRALTHGDKHANFKAIALLWDAYLAARAESDGPIEADDVANMMELLKIARRLNGEFNIDDYIDGAGYAACAGEISAKIASGARPERFVLRRS